MYSRIPAQIIKPLVKVFNEYILTTGFERKIYGDCASVYFHNQAALKNDYF